MTKPASAPQPPKERSCVWHSTKDSVRKGQISLLALAEIPLAMLTFYFIARISPWPWMTLITMAAAPLLLLRSRRSVALGVVMGRRYFKSRELTKTELWLVGGIAAVVSAGVAFWLARLWLPGKSDFDLFISFIILFILTINIFIILFTSCIFMGSIDDCLAIYLCAILSIIISISASVYSILDGSISKYYIFLVFFASYAISYSFISVTTVLLFTFTFPIGIIVFITRVQLIGAIKYFWNGIVDVNKNISSALFVYDICHPPEVIPYFDKSIECLSFNSLLKQLKDEGIFVKIHDTTYIVILFLPATLYRWNIKAGALFWWPLAWLLRPVTWRSDEQMRRETSITTKWMMLVGGFVLSLAIALAIPFLPDSVSGSLKTLTGVKEFLAILPDIGLRYGLLWVLVVCLSGLFTSSFNIRSAHGKPLESAADLQSMIKPGGKPTSEAPDPLAEAFADFKKRSIWIRRWQRGVFVSFVLTVWVFVLWQINMHWPDAPVIWDWLKPRL